MSKNIVPEFPMMNFMNPMVAPFGTWEPSSQFPNVEMGIDQLPVAQPQELSPRSLLPGSNKHKRGQEDKIDGRRFELFNYTVKRVVTKLTETRKIRGKRKGGKRSLPCLLVAPL